MKWIKCSDEYPDQNIDVQVFCSDTKEQFVAFHIGDGLFQFGSHDGVSLVCSPSHWSLKPNNPEE